MTLGSVAARNRLLDDCYGDGHAPGEPATHYLALFVGDPTAAGVELDTTNCPGYTRLPIANTNASWAGATNGSKTTSADLTMAAATGPWSQQPDYMAIMDAPNGGNIGDTGPLASALTIANGQAVRFPAGSLTITQPA